MKVLFAHSSRFKVSGNIFYSNIYPSTIWHRYLNHFDEVIVVGRAEEYKGENINVSSANGVSFRSFPDMTSVSSLINRQKFVALAKTYLEEADAVIVRLPSDTGLIFLEAAKQLNKPVAAEVVGSAWHGLWYHGSLKGKMLAPLSHWNMKRAVKGLNHAIYVTKDYLQQLYPCVGFTGYASNVNINAVVSEPKVKRHPELRITTIGTLDIHYKGYDVVLKALALLKRDGFNDFVFNCIGSGSSKSIVELSIKLDLKDHINVVGNLSTEQLIDFLDNDTDLYIQPSRTEGLPRALVEAMSRGCPALASTVGGIPELLDNEYLHHPGDHHKLSNDIKLYGLNANKLKSMSLKNIEKAKSYAPTELGRRRDSFWGAFASRVRSLSK